MAIAVFILFLFKRRKIDRFKWLHEYYNMCNHNFMQKKKKKKNRSSSYP